MDKSPAELWQSVIAGDGNAWREIVIRYSSLVFAVARRAGLDKYDCEDCAQHTWTSLFRYRKSLRDPAGLPAWLIRTTHRQAVAIAKRNSRRIDLVTQAQSTLQPYLGESEIEALEWRDALYQAMRRLDPRCRKLIESLFFPSEYTTYREIAKLLNVSANAFGPLRSRCLRMRRVWSS